jgi:hypothetical protein
MTHDPKSETMIETMVLNDPRGRRLTTDGMKPSGTNGSMALMPPTFAGCVRSGLAWQADVGRVTNHYRDGRNNVRLPSRVFFQ